MRLYKGTGCVIQLVGILQAMPTLFNQDTHSIFVNRKKPDIIEAITQYHIIINPHDTQRILKFGFPGMVLTVHGDLHTHDGTKIIADKIDFMNFPNDTQSQMLLNNIGVDHFKQHEKSYWYSHKNGLLREELTYIH